MTMGALMMGNLLQAPSFSFFFGAQNVFKVGKLRCTHLVRMILFHHPRMRIQTLKLTVSNA